MEDAASNFARGYYTVGRSILDKFMLSLRRHMENADSVQGFIISHSPSGGTGGGLGSLLHECVSLCYPKTTKINISVLPAPRMCAATVDPYNTTISTHFTMEHTDISFLVDNEALYNVCYHNLMMPNCSYHHVNRILAQLWSAVTASFRYSGVLNSDLCGLLTNLVPFPRLQFPICSFAPIAGRDIADHQEFSVGNLAREVFRPESRFLQFSPQKGKYMACIMMFRGDINISDVAEAVRRVKATDLEFVDWCPTGFKVTINHMPPAVLPQSLMTPSKSNVTMIANTTAIADVWEAIAKKTKSLYNKRAFVHWYVSEGMEEGEINDSLENIATLIQDYRESGIPTEVGDNTMVSNNRPSSVSLNKSLSPEDATSKLNDRTSPLRTSPAKSGGSVLRGVSPARSAAESYSMRGTPTISAAAAGKEASAREASPARSAGGSSAQAASSVVSGAVTGKNATAKSVSPGRSGASVKGQSPARAASPGTVGGSHTYATESLNQSAVSSAGTVTPAMGSPRGHATPGGKRKM